MNLPIPGKSFFVLFAGLALLAFIASFVPSLLILWQTALALSVLLLLLDLFLLYQRPIPEAKRNISGSVPLGVKRDVGIKVTNNSPYPCTMDVFDHFPVQIDAVGLPVHLSLAPEQSASLTYQVTATERGKALFRGVQFRLYSRWGFWQRNYRLSLPSEVHIYPNFAAISHLALLATDNQLSQLGIIKKQRRGRGQDFHQLREYREGDSVRQIDWKATSRLRKVISREYQDERDQEVIFMLDNGHRMRARDGELSHFDHILNALLILSYVALRQGDAVGLSSFAGTERWLKPQKGYHTIQNILNSVYDLQPGNEAPDYIKAASDLLVRHKKRALVILLTNVRDEDSDELKAAVSILRKRHLVLLASLRETSLENALEQAPQDISSALTTAATHHYLQQRKAAFDALGNKGVVAVDVPPQALGVSLINSYLNIKSSGKL
ncbi:DUF58 domain-containing protein [Leucothrix sargassi]|nr:DUF58 domain-containing protein [Leucothrix sargassi]